jgi:DNA polymerase-3 subunit alpha
MMAFATVEDFTGGVELVIFSDPFEKGKACIDTDRMVLITGRVNTREGEAPKVIVSEIVPLEQLTERFNCQLVIKIGAECSESTIDKALGSLEAYPGNAPVLLATRENGTEVFIRSRKYAINVDFNLLNELKELLGDSAAYLRPLNMKEDIS